MVVESRNKKCSIFVWWRGGVTDFRGQSKLCRRERGMSALKKWNVDGGGDSRAMRLHQRAAAVRSFRRVCVILNDAGVVVDVLLFLDLERISSYIVLSSSNRINFGLSLFFTAKVVDWSKN